MTRQGRATTRILTRILPAGTLALLLAVTVSAGPAPLNLEFRDVDVRDVLQVLAKAGQVNIVVGPEVSERVSLALRGVTFDEALDSVLTAGGLRSRQLGSIYVIEKADRAGASIAPPVEAAKVIPLRHITPEAAQGALRTVVPEAAVAVVDGRQAIAVRGASAALQLVEQVLAELDTAVTSSEAVRSGASAPPDPPVPLSMGFRFAAPSQMERAVEEKWPQLDLSVDPAGRHVKGLVPPASAGEIKAFLRQLDLASAQIIIDTRIEEVSSDAMTDLGTRWTTQWQLTEGLSGLFKRGVATLTESDLVQLSALESQGQAKLLANPRIAVIDGQEARIHIGDRVPVEITDVQDGVKVTRLTFIDVGIVLKVTARLDDFDLITADVRPEVSTITSWAKETNYPLIRTRQAATVLRLSDGQTVAIGGLKLQEDTEKKDEVPGLGRLPLIGRLFGAETKVAKRDELVILLTARIAPAYAPAPTEE